MNQTFDFYGQPEIPTFILANPDGTELYNLGSIYDRDFSLRYNALSTFTFTAPSIDNGVAVPYYDSLEFKRLVLIPGVGNYMITKVKKDNDGKKEVKKVTCMSMDVVLSYKKVTLFKGTYNFYNPSSPDGTLMGELLKYIPGWTLETIDADLLGVWRYFSVSDKTLYDFLMNEISQTYQCVFVFDTINQTISAYSVANISNPTDIYISFDNLMKSFSISESTEELSTAMTVLGANSLGINLVNPIGNNVIYDFDYYKTLEWMSQSLIDAINAWEAKIALYQPTYAGLLTDLRTENATLITLQGQLAVLDSNLQAMIQVRDARIQQGLDVVANNAEIVAQEALITSKEAEITAEEVVIATIQVQLTAINTDLLFANNFTSTELSSLNNFIIGNTYTNTNFITTSIMSQVEIQAVAQELYDQGVTVLDKVAQPRYTLEIDSANFLFIQAFQPFITQLSMGCNALVELSEGTTTNVTLLGIDFSYDNPSQFKLILSNRLRLDDEQWKYGDLNGTTTDSGVTTNFDSIKWNNSSDAISILTSGSGTIVLSSSVSNTNNIALFSDQSGNTIKDGGAIYTAPSSFTPAVVSGSDVYTYNFQKGYYNVVGRMLGFQSNLSISGVTGTSGCPVFVQMPTFSKDVENLNSNFSISYQGITLDSGYTGVTGILPPNTNMMQLYQQGSGKTLNVISGSNLSSTTTKLYVSGTYMID